MSVILGQSPNKNDLRRAHVMDAHAHADNPHLKDVVQCPCTPPSTVETFGEEISAEACSGKEIAGLQRGR